MFDVIAQSIDVAIGVDGEASVGVGEDGISEIECRGQLQPRAQPMFAS